MKQKGKISRTQQVEIIAVGADHQNTLGIIRALGNEYVIHLVIHGAHTYKTVRCSQSRYFTGDLFTVQEDEDALLECLLKLAEKKGNETAVIIPTSDFAALCIDKNLDELSKYFILPSIDRQQGSIVRYMDKYEQKLLSDRFCVKMAETVRLDLSDTSEIRLHDWRHYPCILKPSVSARGRKADIAVANTRNDVERLLVGFRGKGYTEILLQEFIHKDYELCAFGCLTSHSREFYYGVLKKLRYYPYKDGASLSYAKMTDSKSMIDPILEMLKNLGYSGLFDIEVFVAGGEVYLNEINFRNSGNTWAIVHNGVNAPAIWIADALGKPVTQTTAVCTKPAYFMNETSDLHYVLDRKLSVFRWLYDLLKTRTFNKFWIRDLRGSLVWYKRRS